MVQTREEIVQCWWLYA